jgi:hypothetical protein
MNTILKSVQTTLTASFGVSRTGKTVTVAVLDSAGNVLGSGYTAGAVVELSDGSYGCAITFTSAFTGYVRFSNTTDSLEIYIPVTVIEDYRADITAIKKIEMNRWKIASNQLTIYDDNGTTPLYVFNLLAAGVANGTTPDERTPV